MNKKERLTRYSVPFNGDLSLMEEVFQTGKIYEVYFAAPREYDLSRQDPSSERFSRNKISTLLKLAAPHKIRTNLLFNSPLLSMRDTKKEIRYVHSIKAQLSSVTIADPYQIAKFRKAFPGLKIEASVIMNLDNYAKIRKILDYGIDVVNCPIDLNRNGSELKKIASLKRSHPGFMIKLLANDECFYGCPFKPYHYFFQDMQELQRIIPPDRDRNDDFGHTCMAASLDFTELVKRPFIRPEDIGFYRRNGYGDIFKLCNRMNETPVLRKKILAYLDEEYDGDLLDIIRLPRRSATLYCVNKSFPRSFIRTVTNCDKSGCRTCTYCKKTGRAVFKRIKA
ncbi:MAG: U32 family peptidase [bacterium]|nr:U32 family peptidase [bacterium]